MNRLPAIMFLACISSCSISRPSPPLDHSPNSPARLAEYRARYAANYATYRCDKSEFPVVQIHSSTLRQFKSVALSRDLRLRLKLGGRFDQPDTFTYRTGSNYILTSALGKELGRAESMLLKNGAPESNEPIKVMFTPSDNSVVVEEQNFGAGGSTRHVVFIPVSASPGAADKALIVWRAFHLDLPARATGVGESDDIGTVAGASGGKIYLEMDGLAYAFPLEKFVTISLGVSNG